MGFESAKVPDSGESASRLIPFRLLFVCAPKGVQAADEMLRIADNLQRG
jgi:hypothetical protein